MACPYFMPVTKTGKWQLAASRETAAGLVDGTAIAPPPATKAKRLRRMFWKPSAIWATPVVAAGRPQNGCGMPCDLPFPRRLARARSRKLPATAPPRALLLDLCLRTRPSARRARRSGVRLVASAWLQAACRSAHPEDGGMFSGIVFEEENPGELQPSGQPRVRKAKEKRP